MNDSPERDDLIEAVLRESAPPGFRDALLTDLLRHNRRRHRTGRVVRSALSASLAGALAVLAWWGVPRHRLTSATTPACTVIRTQPFPAAARVGTRPFGAERMVGSSASVPAVRTRPGGAALRLLDDEELLAVASPRLPALVRTGPHTQELIFLDPGETNGSRLN